MGEKLAFADVYDFPLEERVDKPRDTGLTMIIDLGVSIPELKGILEIAEDFIDIVKISSGTGALYKTSVLKKKIELLRKSNISVSCGGSQFEVAMWKNVYEKYLERLVEFGFSCVEIADGTLPLGEEKRKYAIEKALEFGLKVITEVGKKDPRERIKGDDLVYQIKRDIDWGAYKVIVEGKASGKGVGIFNDDGSLNEPELEKIVSSIDEVDKLLWEAPLREQQNSLIVRLGPNVNLGNVLPTEVFFVEALRRGLMLQPLRNAYIKEKNINKEGVKNGQL